MQASASGDMIMRYDSYKPPLQPPEEPAEFAAGKLRRHIEVMQLAYSARSTHLESLIVRVQEILQETIGKKDERAEIRAGYQRAIKHVSDQMISNEREDGTPCIKISKKESSAYNFLNNPEHFDKTGLNYITVGQSIENLKRKAAESRAAGELFATIDADEAFQAHPEEYLETWREGVEVAPTVAQEKVLKHLNPSQPGCTRNPYAPSLEQIARDLDQGVGFCNLL